jgi:thioredoxin reductase (NADPH)
MSDPFDVIVIGSGVAGLAATKRLAQSGISTANIEAEMFGGLIINVNELDPVAPGEVASGSDFASTLMMEGMDLGAQSVMEAATELRANGKGFVVTTASDEYQARAVIIASGAKLKRLGIPGEMEFDHRGVSQCADCDGAFYRDQPGVVVGGGDSALQEALVLAGYCSNVTLIHRGASFRAKQHFVDAVKARDNITVLFNTVAEAVIGTDAVKSVQIRNLTDGKTQEIPCVGFFAFVGLEPNADFLPPDIARDADGRVKTDASLQTTLPGVFAAGAIRAGCGEYITDAVAEGERAADACLNILQKA